MDTNMILELKEASIVLKKIKNLDEEDFLRVIDEIKEKVVLLTGMGSSYFVSEIGMYFLRNISRRPNIHSCSSDDVISNFPYIDEKYFILTSSQSGNTKEVSELLKNLKEKDINNFSFTNNLDGIHSKIADDSLFLDIGLEKSPVSTKYVIYMILYFYKLSLIDAKNNNVNDSIDVLKYLDDINLLIDFSQNVFNDYNDKLEELVNVFEEGNNIVVIGNGINSYLSKEISLKIRETTGINASFDDVGQLNHGGINSIKGNSLCILLENDENISKKITERGGKLITIGSTDNCDIVFSGLNKYLDSVKIVILLQYFVHKLAINLNIDTDKKCW